MGYNSTLFLCNDALSAITDDPEGFCEKLRRHCGSGTTGTFGHGHHANGFAVVHVEHADTTALIAAGGNFATKVVSVHNKRLNHATEDGQVELLKALASKLGYRVVKKAATKKG